jgi:hypothetical protein
VRLLGYSDPGSTPAALLNPHTLLVYLNPSLNPDSLSSPPTSTCPLRQAQCRGVLPSAFCTSGFYVADNACRAPQGKV